MALSKATPGRQIGKRCPVGKEPGAATSRAAHALTQGGCGRGICIEPDRKFPRSRAVGGSFSERREKESDGIPSLAGY
jgi:hypothetical protein